MLLRNWTLTLRVGGGRGPNQHHQVTRSNHGHRSLLSPRGGKGGMGQGQEGRRMKGKGRKEWDPITTDIGEIAQIACFAHMIHET